jgi:hypothetical protein
VCFCEHGNELSGSIIGSELRDQLKLFASVKNGLLYGVSYMWQYNLQLIRNFQQFDFSECIYKAYRKLFYIISLYTNFSCS